MKESLHPGESKQNKAFAYKIDPDALASADRLVVFIPLPQYGHVIPTLKMATRMKQDGWRVMYFTDAALHPFIESSGMEARAVVLSPEEKARLPEGKSVEEFELYAQKYRILQEELKPTLVLADTYVSTHLLVAIEMGIRVATYTILYDPESKRERPIFRGYPDARNMRQRLFLRFDWLRIMYIRYARRFFTSRHELPAQIHTVLKIWKAGLRLPYYSYIGGCFWVDPIVFGPRALSHGILSDERYFGLCVGSTFGDNGPELARFLRREGKFVYLSFGSMSARYELAKDLLARIARCMSGLEGYNLIVQAGAFARDLEPFVADNVIVQERVDQIGLLRSIDVAISHGGYGSFKECVASGVPFIAIPFSFDQPGNARIAMDLGIGACIDPEQFEEAAFLEALNRLATDPSYKENLARLSDPQRDEQEFETAYRAFCQRIGFEAAVAPAKRETAGR